MNNQTLQFVLLGFLALALIHATVTDLRSRIIENWLNLGIALAAPLSWWASGLSLWPDMAIQIGFGLIITVLFGALFAFGVMGGGDVKLLGALALWISPMPFMSFLIVMSIAGGALTIIMLVRHKWQKAVGQPEIPYGVAIALAGFWSIYERYLNHFA